MEQLGKPTKDKTGPFVQPTRPDRSGRDRNLLRVTAMRVDFECEECDFGIDAVLHPNSPRINELIRIHHEEFGHTKYSIKLGVRFPGSQVEG